MKKPCEIDTDLLFLPQCRNLHRKWVYLQNNLLNEWMCYCKPPTTSKLRGLRSFPMTFPWFQGIFFFFFWSNNCSGTGKLVLAFNFHKLGLSRKTDTKNIFIGPLSNQNCWVSQGCSAEELGFLRGCWTCWLTHEGKLISLPACGSPSQMQPKPLAAPEWSLLALQEVTDTVTPARSLILLVTHQPEGTSPVRVVSYWNRLPRRIMAGPPLEVSKTRLGVALSNLV